MFSRSILKGFAGVSLLISSFTASATPITFEFELPAWDIFQSDDRGGFGNVGTVTVTLDNGSSSSVNQTYNFLTDLLTISAKSDTGYRVTEWNSFQIEKQVGTDFEFVSTDENGIPTLNTFGDEVSFIRYENNGDYWGFGKNSLWPNIMWYVEQPDLNLGGIEKLDALIIDEFERQGIVVDSNQIPNPSTFFLVSLGFVLLVRLHK